MLKVQMSGRQCGKSEKPDTPNQTQIDNCKRWGWEYMGDGYFYSEAKNCFGYFVNRSWRTC